MLNNFSPAMLKAYSECPQKYFLKYVKNVSIALNPEIFKKGKNIHALASYFLKGENIEKFEKILSPSEKQAWQNLISVPYFNLEPVKIEYTVSVKVGEYWFGGRLDALVKSGENFIILDYKTGSVPKNPRDDFQTMIYLLAADKILKNYASLKFVYLDLKNKSQAEIDFDKDLKAEYEFALTKICGDIQKSTACGAFEKKCENCEYKKLCNYA